MYNARRDWKPTISPGYTGRRYYDNRREETNGWFSITGIAFFTGIAFGVTLTLAYVGI